MKRNLIFGLLFFIAVGMVQAQEKYLTNTGTIGFFSHTVLEDIKAESKNVASVIDVSTGELAVIIRIGDFQFAKKLMQEHFNENYLESETYPKARLVGNIVNNGEVNYKKNGSYPASVTGDLTIHGVTKEVTFDGTIEVITPGIGEFRATDPAGLLTQVGCQRQIPVVAGGEVVAEVAHLPFCRRAPKRQRRPFPHPPWQEKACRDRRRRPLLRRVLRSSISRS